MKKSDKEIKNKKSQFLDKINSNKKWLIIGGLVVLVIIVIIVLVGLFNNEEFVVGVKNPDGAKFKNEYEELNGVQSEDGREYPEVNISSSNVFYYSSATEIVNLIKNKSDGVVYMGYSDCVYCRSAVQVLCDTAEDTEIDKIYYLDVDKISNSEKQQVINVLEDKFLTETGDIYVPLVLFVAEGNVVSHNKGTLFSQTDPYRELDASQKQGLSEIYRYGIGDVLEAMKHN